MSKSSKVRHTLLAIVMASVFALLSSGCTGKTEDDSTIPWSRPASWEGQMPGFGG